MTKTYEDKAWEWFYSCPMRRKDLHHTDDEALVDIRTAVLSFGKTLDKEAQEKPCDTKPSECLHEWEKIQINPYLKTFGCKYCGIVQQRGFPEPEKPQQPEKIVWDEREHESRPVESAINANLIKIGKLLESRLTHKD